MIKILRNLAAHAAGLDAASMQRRQEPPER